MAMGIKLPEVPQDLEEHPRPVGAVGELAQVGERLLGAARHALHLRQLVAEGDQQLAVALALVRRQDHDARHVVACGGKIETMEGLNHLQKIDFDKALARYLHRSKRR